jgi:hypothetical protein
MSRNCERRGDYYWCIKTSLSEDGELYVYADEIKINETGDLIAVGHRTDKTAEPNLGIAAGQWSGFYAASVLDGSAIAVEHWKGEVVN